jgi:hypothetical protein
MADHELLTSQRNEVLSAITEAGLNPTEFEWLEVDSGASGIGLGAPPYIVQALVHSPTGAAFSFDIDASSGQHLAIFHPGYDGPTQRVGSGSWNSQISYVRQWLGYVNREYNAPDLWAEVQGRRELIAGELHATGNTPFTPEEQGQIAAQLREISAYVRRTHELTPAQQEALDARLGYLEDAATRMERIDWRNTFVGVMMGVVVEAILPADAVREAVALALRGLAHLFGLPAIPS